jgi:predicted AlkP superfamily phosphohydrolase/phosphomutase
LKLIQEEQWHFFLAVFSMLHQAGHRLWSTVNIYDFAYKSQKEKDEADDALRQVYIAFDKALAELINAIKEPPHLTFIFSFYGMQHNRSREVILPEMLRRVLNANDIKSKPSETKLKQFMVRMRHIIPNSWRHKIKSKLPYPIRYKLVSFWRLGQLNWNNIKAFVIPLEINIGIRINLKGREKLGVVEAGVEYKNLCEQIMNGLLTFKDADTGIPLVKEFHLAKNIFKGDHVTKLPDLIGVWSDDPSAHHRLITSTLYGDIPWPTPGKNPEGRSGNHNADGFLITHGEGTRKGTLHDVHILDFAPTILHLLDEPIPANFEGKILSLLID